MLKVVVEDEETGNVWLVILPLRAKLPLHLHHFAVG